MVEWWQLARAEDASDANNVRGLNMYGLFITSVFFFFLYRFVSAYYVWEFTGKLSRGMVQFLDLEILRVIYTSHISGRDEPGALQRWIQKNEAIYESAPQSLYVAVL